MFIKLFSIYDSKVSNWSSPLPFKHSGDALRWFSERANIKDNNIGKYPHDFSLHEVGSFEESTGKLFPMHPSQSLGIAIEFVKNDFNEKQLKMGDMNLNS